MEKRDFVRQENICQFRFNEEAQCFHVCSGENHPVLFHDEEEFKAAMNAVAFVAFLFPEIKIFTFEVMDNHFHFTVSGERKMVDDFVGSLVAKLSSHPSLIGSRNDCRTLSFKILPIDSLENLRNVIAYNNRNGALVTPDENIFTYRWGANRFFFNREATLRFEECGRSANCREKRKMFGSAQVDKEDGVIMLDGYVSPLCYCHIKEAESFFRSNRHYFYTVVRNVESGKEIAKSIGEGIFYTDEDLFSHIRFLCSKRYGCQSISSLPSEAKVEIAKELHFDYNASNKQICRLLKIDFGTVETLFPMQ